MILNDCYVSVGLFCTVCNDFDLENCRSESFSIRTYKGRAPVSELVLLRGGHSKMFIFGSIMDSKLPPCNAISEGRPPLSNTSSEAGALP